MTKSRHEVDHSTSKGSKREKSPDAKCGDP
jgi:hypothetical protein